MQLGTEFESAWSDERKLNRNPRATDAAHEKSYARVSRIVRLIERTPAHTLAGLRVKARAVAWCHAGVDTISLARNPTTDVRLAQSIVRDLIALR